MTIYTVMSNEKFINAGMALMAATSVQNLFTMRGNLVCSHFNLETKSLEVTIHMKSAEEDMTLPTGYIATAKEYSEHASHINGKMIYCTSYFFRFED